ncbi:MAG: hypothetical protein ACOC33_00500 [bacterium]
MIFKIKKGKHSSSGFKFGFTFKKSIKFSVEFLKNSLYKFPQHYSDRLDVNKVFGFSTSFYHHYQSARLGWRCLDGENIQLFPYCYVNWKLQLEYLKEPLLEVKPNDNIICEISDTGESYSFKIQNITRNITKIIKIEKKKDWFMFHYFLYPYFGGNLVAPNTMEIKISK